MAQRTSRSSNTNSAMPAVQRELVEQRRHTRMPAAVKVTIETEHDFYAGLSGDLGFGGVFFVSDDPPPPGTAVRLAIRLPTGGTVRAEGCVRWTRAPEFASPELPAGCGVAWRSLDARSAEAVRRFMEERETRRRGPALLRGA